MFSCIFNLSKHALALGGGIPLAFFIFDLMAQVSEDLEWFQFLTMNTLFDTSLILDGGGFGVHFIVLLIIGVVLYGIGIRTFVRKDLPL